MHVQMKDTSVFSFRDNESLNMGTVLKKRDKEMTIEGRKMEELNRVKLGLHRFWTPTMEDANLCRSRVILRLERNLIRLQRLRMSLV